MKPPISRRGLLETAAAALAFARPVSAQTTTAVQKTPAEWSFRTGKSYADPFNDVELDVVFRDSKQKQYRVPAFWAGENMWKVRFAPPDPGDYTWTSVCTDTANKDLHGAVGTFSATPYSGANPLITHGAIRVASDRRHFEHADGTPFFWLGDTWWMGLTKRLHWPEDFEWLTKDRTEKGFTVVQIVAGLYPDMPWYDERGANEAGYPWTQDFSRINPAYFDQADTRIRHLVDNGVVPCIVGCWGYFLPQMGMPKIKQHWRYLVARWGSAPVTWCLAGEATMPYYLSKQPKEDAARQKQGWTEVARYVRDIDPCKRIITTHPSSSARDSVEDDRVLDFDMLQTGHSDRESIPNTIRKVTGSRAREPKMPVINGEVCYEGIIEASRQEVQRFMFWSCILSGAAGHTYGANGLWQVNRQEKPYGPSPHGRSWGDVPWDVAAKLPGSTQLGWSKRLLMQFPWERMEPHPEWSDPHWSESKFVQPYAAGIPGELRVFFIPPMWNMPVVRQLEPKLTYRGMYYNPATGKTHTIGNVVGDDAGNWQMPNPPVFQDFILVLARQKG